MTYEEYKAKYRNRDHVLIRMTDVFPFFIEKVFVIKGEKRIERNYHVADGMFSTYINIEMPKGGFSIEISGVITFDISGLWPYPVLVTNAGQEPLEIRLLQSYGMLEPDEVLPVSPESYAKMTCAHLEEDMLKRYESQKRLGQNEINKLLGGE